MLGTFLILPVFSVMTLAYPDGTSFKAGLALGIYSFFQAIFQIPAGWLSDRFGRKPLILGGLFLFSTGSFLSGQAQTLTQLIFTRALQGCGSIGSVIMAYLGDQVSTQRRAQAFMILNFAVGGAFILGLLFGPALNHLIGFSGLFYILSGMAFMAFMITLVFLPSAGTRFSDHQQIHSLLVLYRSLSLIRLAVANFVISFLIHHFFFLFPIHYRDLTSSLEKLSVMYLVILLPAGILAFPLIRQAEKANALPRLIVLGWLLLCFSYVLFLTYGSSKAGLFFAGATFFLGYAVIQPALPALLSLLFESTVRGSAMGFFNLLGYLGLAFGGIVTGILYEYFEKATIGFALFLLVGWMFVGLPRQKNVEKEGFIENG